MKYIYLDNIRGFNSATIPIRKVTFLAGENSTGKSTLLSVLNLLSNNGLFGDFDFDSDEYHMGGFDDIVSQKSEDKQSFTIGISQINKNSDEKELITYFISFESDDGIPKPRRFSYIDIDTFVSVRETNNGLSYRLVPIESQITGDDAFTKENIERLGRLHKNRTNKGFKQMEFGRNQKNPFALFMSITTIERPNSKNGNRFDPFMVLSHRNSPAWIAPIRAKPKRTYDSSRVKYSSEGNHAPYMLRQITTQKKHGNSLVETLKACGIEGHLFDDLSVNTFGDSKYGPFEVKVDLQGSKHSIANVGYGVSQSMPVMIDSIARSDGSELHIQQPEVHLHPRAQAALGSLFWKLATEDDKYFIIETHSDYLIDRFRLEISNSTASVDSSVLFFSRDENGNKVEEIPIDSNGKYPLDQPAAFRDFFMHEQLSLLSL